MAYLVDLEGRNEDARCREYEAVKTSVYSLLFNVACWNYIMQRSQRLFYSYKLLANCMNFIINQSAVYGGTFVESHGRRVRANI